MSQNLNQADNVSEESYILMVSQVVSFAHTDLYCWSTKNKQNLINSVGYCNTLSLRPFFDKLLEQLNKFSTYTTVQCAARVCSVSAIRWSDSMAPIAVVVAVAAACRQLLLMPHSGQHCRVTSLAPQSPLPLHSPAHTCLAHSLQPDAQFFLWAAHAHVPRWWGVSVPRVWGG